MVLSLILLFCLRKDSRSCSVISSTTERVTSNADELASSRSSPLPLGPALYASYMELFLLWRWTDDLEFDLRRRRFRLDDDDDDDAASDPPVPVVVVVVDACCFCCFR